MSEGPEHASPESLKPDQQSGDPRALRLEAQLAAVTARVFQLEREVAALRGTSPPVASIPDLGRTIPAEAATTIHRPAAASAMPPGVTQPAAQAEAVQYAQAAVSPAARPVQKPRDQRSLESRVGSQWLNRIGIIAVLIGVASFLKFAFDNHWVGQMGRVLVGLLCGAALVAWSERFRSKGYPAFSYSLKAVGSGVLYLSLWASFSMYHLISPGMAFAGMIVVTAFNAFISWIQDAELLAVYAIVGAFSTPLLLATGHSDEVFLFSYLLMMNAATLTLLVLKGWNRLLVLSFAGTVAFFWGWYGLAYTPAAFGTTATFLVLFFLLFAAATILARRKRTHGAQEDAARVLVSLANAAFGFLGFYAMLSHGSGNHTTTLAWCAVAFGAFYLGVRQVMERTPIEGTSLASLSDVQLSISIVFLTLAIPLAVSGHWVTIGWLAEGAVLVWLATRMRTLLMRLLALGALLLGLVSLAMDATTGQTQVLWNTRCLSFAVAVAAITISTLLARREAKREAAQAGSAAMWGMLASTGAVVAHLLVVIAGLLEIHTYWWSGTSPNELRMANSLLSSAIWLMAAGAAALWAASRRLSSALRWEGVSLQGVGLLVLFSALDYPQLQVLWNLRFAAFLVAIASIVWSGLQSRRAAPAEGARRTAMGRGLVVASVIAVTVLTLLAVAFEIHTYWWTRPQAAAVGSQVYIQALADRRMAAQFTYSAWFLLAGAALLAAGFRRRSALLRWQGLALLAITIVKVFLIDMSQLSQGYRIISFLGLGALLLGVSFAYQKDWLHLRAATTSDGGEPQ